MKRSRLFVLSALATSFGWLLAGGCASDDSSPSQLGPSGGGSLSDAQGDATVVRPDTGTSLGGSGDRLNPLCGAGECVPDEARACLGYEAPEQAPGSGGVAGSDGGGAAGGGEGSTSGAAQGGGSPGGSGSENGGGEGGNGGSFGQSSAGQGGENAGAGGALPEAPLSYGCQVRDQDNRLARSCQVAGLGKVNAPCFSAADCQPSLACITEGENGRCLPYCCEGDNTCKSGTYCAERQLRKPSSSTSETEEPLVPVCVPADDCSLEDAFPCPEGTDCRCKGTTACTVVRADGTTTCLTPGTGQQGEACPCAWNHVCSSAAQKCVKICRTDPDKNDCGSQKCQASSELPQNFGVCVGPLK